MPPAAEPSTTDHEGESIAGDRHARVLRRLLWPAAALAVAGLLAVYGAGCDRSEVPPVPAVAGTNLLPTLRTGATDGDFSRDYSTRTNDGGPTAEVFRLTGRGYAVTPDDYGPDFTVTYEYRFPEADTVPEADRPKHNTGCLLFITGEDKVWPRCLEVQGRWDDTAQIKSNARDVQVTATLDEAARDAARKPPGEWNKVKVVSRGGALTVTLNGVEVSTSEPTDLTRGRIGFQAEGFPVEFRGGAIGE